MGHRVCHARLEHLQRELLTGPVRRVKQVGLQHLIGSSVRTATTTKQVLVARAPRVIPASTQTRTKQSAYHAHLAVLVWKVIVWSARLGWSRTGVKIRGEQIRRTAARAVLWMLHLLNLHV